MRRMTTFIIASCVLVTIPFRAWAAAPANDAFTARQVIAGLSGSVPGTTVDATLEGADPCPASVCGARSVWYRWTAPSNGVITMTVTSAAINPIMGVYRGASLPTLNHVASNDDQADSTDAQVTFDTISGVVYQVHVNAYPTEGQEDGVFSLLWSMTAAPANDAFAEPTVLSATGTGTVSGTTLAASREGPEPCPASDCSTRSVWFRWTAPAPGGTVVMDTIGSSLDTVLGIYTGSSLEDLDHVGSNDDAPSTTRSRVTFTAITGTQYRIYVVAKDGDSVSPGGPITLNWASAPLNDAFNAATSLLGVSGQTTTSTAAASAEEGEPAHAGQPANASVWFTWTAPEHASMRFTTQGSNFDTVLAVYQGGTFETLTPVISNNDSVGVTSAVTFCVAAGSSYRIAVDGFSGARGALTLAWGRGMPTNDAFASAATITGPSGSTTCGNVLATDEISEPSHAGRPGSTSVWFNWTAPGTGQVVFQTTQASFDTVLAIYTGTLGALTPVASNDNLTSGTTLSEVTINAVSGTTYRIALDGGDGAAGSYTLDWFIATAIRQEVGPGIAHSWALVTDGQAVGGSFRVARDAGATLTFPFTGTGIKWITHTGPTFGKAKVTIDGANKGTIDLYSASLSRNVHKTFAGLSSGAHTITIRALGLRHANATDMKVIVDGFKIGTRTVAGPAGTMAWARPAAVGALGGSYATASHLGATLNLTFSGTQLRLNYVMTPASGRAQLLVDGVVRSTIDAYAATTRFGAVETVSGLAAGTHVAQIRILGTRRAAASDTSFGVDRFVAS